MRILFSILPLTMLLFSCSFQKKGSSNAIAKVDTLSSCSLELEWESDSIFQTPESLIYYEKSNEFFVSNVNTEPWGKNGDGFISKMDISGNITELNWIEGFNSPKGMGIIEDFLYVADLDCVVKIDIQKGEITERINIENEDGLNDIATGINGELYVSSSSNSIIYRVKDSKVTKLVQGGDERYNGLYYLQEGLMLVTSKGQQLKKFNFESGEFTILANDIGSGDGIVKVEDDVFIISDWSGEIFLVNKDYSLESLLDTKAVGKNTADMCYLPSQNLLLVPTFSNNTVVAYTVKGLKK
ncbi:hypothetical protein [Saccharicrinis aurantiacus]|uniref:hypothetical protein n=1 Tax=Saccharicrinis aurantiacus TaxID=1849719 RepID=UPI002490480B|nr:hypothetical protein [Saccharicrinis aurantiacus]